MMLDPRTFMGHCLAGTARAEDLDDWIDRWHDGDSTMELHEYLGLTFEEYGNLALAPAALPHILAVREMVERGRLAITRMAAEAAGRIN